MTQKHFLRLIPVLAVLLLFRNQPVNAEIARDDFRRLVVSNDVCEGAAPISIGVPFFVDTSNSTPDNIANDCIATYYDPGLYGLWYTFLGTGERLFGRSRCAYETAPTSTMSVFTGSCSNLQCVGGMSGLCRGAIFFFDTIAGTTYRVLVQAPSLTFWNDFATIHVAPPPVVNDVCQGALPIAIGAKISANVTFAASDALNDDCFNNGLDRNYPGVWYSFVGTGERLLVRACGRGPYLDTTITILQGSCEGANFNCAAATREPCAQERFGFDSVQGTTYYLLLRSDAFFATEMIVDLSISVGTALGNDLCENAQAISIGSRLRVNLLPATSEQDDVYAGCIPYYGSTSSDPGVWYTFVGNGKRVVGRLRSSCDQLDATSIAFFSGGCNTANFLCVAGTLDLCSERVLFPTVKGTTYHVLLKSRNPEKILDLKIATCGLFRLGIFCPPTLNEFLDYVFECLLRSNCT
jgi:hypothetical protein